jgi:hypothetical protein
VGSVDEPWISVDGDPCMCGSLFRNIVVVSAGAGPTSHRTSNGQRALYKLSQMPTNKSSRPLSTLQAGPCQPGMPERNESRIGAAAASPHRPPTRSSQKRALAIATGVAGQKYGQCRGSKELIY